MSGTWRPNGWMPVDASPSAPSGIAQPTTGEGVPVAAGNPPGFDATTQAAAAQQVAMTTRAQNFAADMFPLYKAQQELAQAPTGPGTETGLSNIYGKPF